MIINNKVLKISYYFIDSDFETFCKEFKLKYYEIKKKNYSLIQKVINEFSNKESNSYGNQEESRINLIERLSKSGVPDFFVWDEKSFVFVEYKTLTDKLRTSQIDFFFKNPDLKIVVVHSLKRSYDINQVKLSHN